MPSHRVLQQTPSTQNPLAHSVEVVQRRPLAAFATQAPSLQKLPGRQEASLEQGLEHFPAAQT
jgi:hypothetical protein